MRLLIVSGGHCDVVVRRLCVIVHQMKLMRFLTKWENKNKTGQDERDGGGKGKTLRCRPT